MTMYNLNITLITNFSSQVIKFKSPKLNLEPQIYLILGVLIFKCDYFY